jgi:hypothetical protein
MRWNMELHRYGSAEISTSSPMLGSGRPPCLRWPGLLEDLGFTLEGASSDDVGHRFARGSTRIDLLAPDGVGSRADLRVQGSTRTVMVPGGTFALARTELVDIEAAGRTGRVPRPDLVGAITIKAIAAHADSRGKERHRVDLALLLSLVPDPILLANILSAKQRRDVVHAGLPAGCRLPTVGSPPTGGSSPGSLDLGRRRDRGVGGADAGGCPPNSSRP